MIHWQSTIRRLFFVGFLSATLFAGAGGAKSDIIPPEWTIPDISALPDNEPAKLIRLGRDLTVDTHSLIGPGASPDKRYAGNALSCQNCHLEAGTKRFGLPFVGVATDFPQYRAREGHVGTLEDRINGCMTRSMNGRPLPDDSREMRAFVAYNGFLSTGPKQEGRGAGQLPELGRAADPKQGEVVFKQVCVACHGADGLGKRSAGTGAADSAQPFGAQPFGAPPLGAPPLWGPESFNDGAGMNRLISAANFIRSNMPNGVAWQSPLLSVQDSWDVAAFVISQDRPRKTDLDRDFPKRLEKPVDAAYPPFADGFAVDAHRFGPFQPIREKIRALQASMVTPTTN